MTGRIGGLTHAGFTSTPHRYSRCCGRPAVELGPRLRDELRHLVRRDLRLVDDVREEDGRHEVRRPAERDEGVLDAPQPRRHGFRHSDAGTFGPGERQTPPFDARYIAIPIRSPRAIPPANQMEFDFATSFRASCLPSP